MSRAIINVVNTTSGTTIADGSTYPVNQVLRRFGCGIESNGTGVTCKDVGYYSIEATVTGVASAAGVVTASIYENGAARSGATCSTTVASGDTFTLPLQTEVRVTCCAVPSDITIVVNGVAITSVNANLKAVKD